MWNLQYKPIKNYHVENAILRKDFNLGVIGFLFHAFTQHYLLTTHTIKLDKYKIAIWHAILVEK
jgi:hypothetical protein